MDKERIRLYCAAALAAMTAFGCTTDEDGSLVIVQNQIPGADCVIPPTPSTFRGRGQIDAQSTQGYVFTPVVKSLLVVDPKKFSDRVVAVEGADVDIEFPNGFFSSGEEAELRSDRLTRFSQAFSGSVQPGGFTSFGFVVVPPGLLGRLAEVLGDGDSVEVTVEVVIFGDLGGGNVESSPFRYPIEVCDGCMKIDNGDCALLGESFEPLEGGVCNTLQDSPVDCCTAAGVERCPAST